MIRKTGLVRATLLRISVVFFCTGLVIRAEPVSRRQILDTMAKATDFMMNTVSNRGGFVWAYSLDLEPFGELSARKSMIWVEPPGTPSVGIMLLEAYKATGDESYLDCARRVAEPLIWGQHPSGGWNYFIDFDPAGLQDYYDNFFSKCWGWQEYLHNYGNCTFDDFSTTEPTRFLLRLYEVTRETKYQEALNRALDHIVRAQYPNGAWPQRYPTGRLFPREDLPDYTPFYTFNDGVMLDNIKMLLEAHAALGDPRFQIAARKGMDFYLLARLPEPQAGWAQQYDFDLRPAWGRPFEIGTVCAGETASCIQDLMHFYKITGDGRYLDAIPSALDWLERSVIPDAGGYTHTYYYELGTNRPQYILQTGETIEDVQYTVTDEVDGSYPYGNKISLDIDSMRQEYGRVKSLTPEEARAEYEVSLKGEQLPHEVKGGYLAKALSETSQDADGIAAIVGSLDDRGGWQETVEIMDPFSPFTKPPRKFKGYTTGGYIGRMYRLINYLNAN